MAVLALVSSLLVASSTVLAASGNFTFDSSGCVSSSGYDSCNAQVAAKEQACDSTSGGDTEVDLACGCVSLLGQINCAVEQCWNEVYSCQYQALVVQYLELCPAISTIPYFPAPDNAPGGCSCNIGQVYLNAASSFAEGSKCKASTNFEELPACICCVEASALTSVYGICPDTNPSLIGLATIDTDMSAFDQPFDTCGQYLSQVDCIKDLGFTPIGSGSLVNPMSMPPNGTQTLYTTGGPITSPISPTVTWSHGSSTYVATAVTGQVSVGSGGSGSSAGVAAASASNTGATSTTGASTTGASSTGASSTSGNKSGAAGGPAMSFLSIGASLLVLMLSLRCI